MSAQKPMISPYEVNELTKYCLKILTYTDELRSDTALKQAYEKAKELENSIRKLKIASLMENKTLICVAGMQGAGKTTLMKNFYGLKGDALSIELGRGERIPVLITETDVTAPVMNAIRIQKNEAGEYAAVECNMEANEFAHASKGEDNSILYLEMFVPYRHTYNSAVSFMLLPGFEKNNDYWRELINFAVNSSDAAVFAFDESRFSQGDSFEQLKKLTERFGNNIIYAITQSDASKDDNEEVRQSCIKALEIPQANADRVVCTGQYDDEKKNEAWIEKLKNAIERYASTTDQSARDNARYLYDEVEHIKNVLYSIKEVLKSDDSAAVADYKDNTILNYFDRALAKKRKEYEEVLEKEFAKGAGESKQQMENILNSNKEKGRSLISMIFTRGNSIKDVRAARENVMRSLQAWDGASDQPKYLPDQCMLSALATTMKALDTPQKKTDLQWLLESENKDSKKALKAGGEKSLQLTNDVCALVSQQPPKDGIQTQNTRRLMSALVDIAVYYYGVLSSDDLAMVCSTEGKQVKGYTPSESKLEMDHIQKGAQEAWKLFVDLGTTAAGVKDMADASKRTGIDKLFRRPAKMNSSSMRKFAIGLGSMAGMDLLGDATINMIPQIAASFSVSNPVIGIPAMVLVVSGGTIAALRDLSGVQCENLRRANTAIDSIYTALKEEELKRFDKQMARLRDTIQNNLEDLNGDVKKPMKAYNAKAQVDAALELLQTISARSREEFYAM